MASGAEKTFRDRDKAREAGRKGGLKVKETRGEAYYREIGKKGGDAIKAKRGSEYLREIGRRGAAAKHGKAK